MKHIVQFSGGKDSTAMLLRMVEEGMPIDAILFVDTGLEFPQMYEHIKKVETFINRKITIIKAEHDFEWFLFSKPIKNITAIRKRTEKGFSLVGTGFPLRKSRWCTKHLKLIPKNKYLEKLFGDEEIYSYIGIAADEEERVGRNPNENNGDVLCYPLVEWGMTEAECLNYCRDRGFDWGGLYDDFSRVSCWCCPLQNLKSLATLYKKYPDLWAKLEEWDLKAKELNLTRFALDGLDKQKERLIKRGLI